jgi:hypothetical protein
MIRVAGHRAGDSREAQSLANAGRLGTTATWRAESAFVAVDCEVLIRLKHNKYRGALEIYQIS